MCFIFIYNKAQLSASEATQQLKKIEWWNMQDHKFKKVFPVVT